MNRQMDPTDKLLFHFYLGTGFFELSNEQALIRPPTPAYTNAALVYEKALADIADGGDVQSVLDAAIDEIDQDIEDNDGYGF